MEFKNLVVIALTFGNISCSCMLPSYHSGADMHRENVVVSEINDEAILEVGYQFYKEGLDLQRGGARTPTLHKYKAAFLGKDNFEELNTVYESFKSLVEKNQSFDNCLVDIIKKSAISSVASNIASIYMQQNVFLKAAFWYAISYMNGNSFARNSFENALTYYNNSEYKQENK